MPDENIYQIPVNDYPNQVQTIEMFGYNLQFTLLYNSIGKSWSFDLYDNAQGEYIVRGEGLSTNQPSLFYSNLPFVIIMLDEYGLGFEPIAQNEMGDRFSINIMSREAYTNAIRQTISFNGWQSN